MPVKTFFDDGQELVLKSLEGLCATNPELIFNRGAKSVRYAHHDGSKKVTLIAGGGAGHEPAHAAFVGQGMLSAAVSGNIFASPSVKQIVETIGSVGGSAGTILIVKNYTGDIFHFHLAAEKARARWGHRVEVLVVGDDVAVGRKKSGKVGRRGLAGTVLVHKILGSLAAAGKSIDELLATGKEVVDSLVTCGVSQGHVHIPGTAYQDEEAQVELGMGIHNEPGAQILYPRPTLDNLLERMLDMLLSHKDADRAYVDFEGQEPVLLVNNLGGTSQLELGALVTETLAKLSTRGVITSRAISGTFMTSLDASGFSITLLRVNPDVLLALDAATSAAGWCQAFSNFQVYNGARVEESQESATKATLSNAGPKVNSAAYHKAVSAACKSLLAAEPKITEADRIVGDGDCGSTLARGANAALKTLTEIPSDGSTSASAAIMRIAHAIEESMDGTSGALYELFFTALGTSLQSLSQDTMSVSLWADAAGKALQRLQAMTPARPGDRTLMDALVPYVEALASGGITKAVEAAQKGRDTTQGMEASLGRAVYVAGENFSKVADPGAEGIVAIAQGLAGQTS